MPISTLTTWCASMMREHCFTDLQIAKRTAHLRRANRCASQRDRSRGCRWRARQYLCRWRGSGFTASPGIGPIGTWEPRSDSRGRRTGQLVAAHGAGLGCGGKQAIGLCRVKCSASWVGFSGDSIFPHLHFNVTDGLAYQLAGRTVVLFGASDASLENSETLLPMVKSHSGDIISAEPGPGCHL